MTCRLIVVIATALVVLGACGGRGPIGIGPPGDDSGGGLDDAQGPGPETGFPPLVDGGLVTDIAPIGDVIAIPDGPTSTGRLASRYISAWIGRASGSTTRVSSSSSYSINASAKQWKGSSGIWSDGAVKSVAGTYNVSGAGTGSLAGAGLTRALFVPANGGAFIVAATTGTAQWMEIAVKATRSNFSALDAGINGQTLGYALIRTTNAGSAGVSIGTMNFKPGSARGGTWTAVQQRGRNLPIGYMPASGTFKLGASGGITIDVGSDTFVGGAQDEYGMLIGARVKGGAGLFVAVKRAVGGSATRYNGKVLRNVWLEDSATTTMAGIAAGTFTSTSTTAGAIRGTYSGTFTQGGTASTDSGTYAETVSAFTAGGTFTTDDAEPARYRYQLNNDASLGVYIDAEERAGSDVELGIIVGN